MSQKTCFKIFVIALIIFLVSYVFRISVVTKEIEAVFRQMQNIYIALSSLAISLILAKTKHYWWIMVGISVVAGAVVQVMIVGGALMTMALLYKILAYVVYAYLFMLARYMS